MLGKPLQSIKHLPYHSIPFYTILIHFYLYNSMYIYTLYTLYTLSTLYTLYTLSTLYTLYTVYTLYTLYIICIIYIIYIIYTLYTHYIHTIYYSSHHLKSTRRILRESLLHLDLLGSLRSAEHLALALHRALTAERLEVSIVMGGTNR